MTSESLARTLKGKLESGAATSLKPLEPCDFFFFFLRFYLLIHESRRERGRDTGKGRSRLSAGSPMQDSIPGPRDDALSRQTLNH